MEWSLENIASLAEIHNYRNTVSLTAAFAGHLSVTEWLLQNGVSLTNKDEDENTALSIAVSRGNLPLILCLLERGAPIAQSLTFDGVSTILETYERRNDTMSH